MEDTNAIATCKNCQCTMDISTLQPFTNVECPECSQHMRVKVDVGAYILRKRQGVGGMSLVFGAVDKTLGRECAIKILNEDYSMDEKRITQFEQEARITAAMSHPHIVKVYTVGQAFNRFFIAMEMVSGDSLEEKMRSGKGLPEGDILHWAQQIADGLNAANEAGLIHRDIKPGNVLFDKDGHVKIVDFGLALVTQGGKAQADEIWATPYYVPPEALDILEEDFRSDIYALGASLYHALSGHPPFNTESRSTTELKEIKRNIPPLREVAPWLHDETCAIIDKCMAFEMDDRYHSYQELIEALHYTENLVLNEGANPPAASAKRAQRRAAKPWHQNSIIMGGIGAGLVVAVGAIIMFATGSKKETPEEDDKPVAIGSGGGGGNVGSGLSKNVAQEITAARSLLRAKNYSAAASHYTTLTNDKNIDKDTVFWAGINAATLHWLDGKPGTARKLLRDLVVNNRGKDGAESVIGKRLEAAVDSLTGYGKLSSQSVPKIKNEIDAIIAFASGIKNWSLGHMEEAQILLKRVRNCKISEPSEEFLYYQARIGDYLNDASIIAKYSDFTPVSKSDCDARDVTLSKIKFHTKGRVQYDLEEWKTQNEIHRKRLERIERERKTAEQQKQANPKVEWAKISAETTPLISKCEFKNVVAYLVNMQIKGKGNDLRKNELLYLCENAMGYKIGIIRSLKSKTTSTNISTKSGSTYKKIYGVSELGFVVRENSKNKVVPWNEVDPVSIIDLHKFNVLGKLSDFEKNIRLEQAVCFAKLMGEESKASKGAKTLMESDPGFKKRWNQCNKVLNAKP